MTQTSPEFWLSSLDFAGPGVMKTVGFYKDLWKLFGVGQQNEGAFLRGTGPEPYLLGLHDGPSRGLLRITFGVRDRPTLLARYQALADAGVRLLGPPAPLATPGGGFGFELLDPDRRVLRLATETTPNAPPPGTPAELADAPMKISHIVLNTVDIDGAMAFYTEKLGFRVSDWSEDQMVFLRCTTDHHSIAFNRADHVSVNHVAFELRTLDAYMRGIGRLKHGGYPVNWGPGRHGPGDNPFAYYIGPSGFVIEYTTGLEQINEATHQPRVWQRTPEQSDRWLLAGPPSRQMRHAMAGDPDAGYQG